MKEKAAETRIIVKTMAEGAIKKPEIEYRNIKVSKDKIAKKDQISESEANQLSCLLSRNDAGNVRVVAEDLIDNIRSLETGGNYVISERSTINSAGQLRHGIRDSDLPVEDPKDISAQSAIWPLLTQMVSTKSCATSISSDEWCSTDYDHRLSKEGSYRHYKDKIVCSDPFMMGLILVYALCRVIPQEDTFSYFKKITQKILSQMHRYIQHSHDRGDFIDFDQSKVMDCANYIDLFEIVITSIEEQNVRYDKLLGALIVSAELWSSRFIVLAKKTILLLLSCSTSAYSRNSKFTS